MLFIRVTTSRVELYFVQTIAMCRTYKSTHIHTKSNHMISIVTLSECPRQLLVGWNEIIEIKQQNAKKQLGRNPTDQGSQKQHSWWQWRVTAEGDNGGWQQRSQWSMKMVGDNGGWQWWMTMVGDNRAWQWWVTTESKQRWVTTESDHGGWQRWVKTVDDNGGWQKMVIKSNNRHFFERTKYIFDVEKLLQEMWNDVQSVKQRINLGRGLRQRNNECLALIDRVCLNSTWHFGISGSRLHLLWLKTSSLSSV